jgi:hypothetical protein
MTSSARQAAAIVKIMRAGLLGALMLSAGACATLAGLDGDFTVGETGTGGSGTTTGTAAATGTAGTGTPAGQSGGGGFGAAGGSAGGAGGTGGSAGTGGTGGTGGGSAVDYCEEAGLVACYPFEGNGDDESSTGNDATTTSVQYAAGQVGQAIVLDATSRVTVAPSSSLAVGPYTLEIWVNPSSIPQSGRFGIGDWTVVFNAWLYPYGVRCNYDWGEGTGSPIPTNQWTHVACANDGTTLRTYINGVETASEAFAPNSAAPTATSYIGANEPGGNDNWLGMLDQMRLFDHARSPGEICAAAAPNCS